MKRKAESDLNLSNPKRQKTDHIGASGLFSDDMKIPSFQGNHEMLNRKDDGIKVCHAKLCSVSTMHELSANYKKLRYILDCNYQLWFGREGQIGEEVPKHFQMTDNEYRDDAYSTTAGNIFYNENGEVVGISNKSGDFLPRFDSIKWALAAMFACDVSFSEYITVYKSYRNGEEESFELSTKQLKDEVIRLFSPEQLDKFVAANKSLGTKTLELGKEWLPPENSKVKGIRRALTFLDNLSDKEEYSPKNDVDPNLAKAATSEESESKVRKALLQ